MGGISAWSRRDLLKMSGAGAIAFAATALPRFERRARAATPDKPRFYLQIIPQGGLDPVYSLDPKTPAEVDQGIDVPYPPDKIITAGGLRLGPAFQPLAAWAPRMAIVNCLRQNSANHPSGYLHTTRCKTQVTQDAPAVLEILGARRHGEAAGAVSLNGAYRTAYSTKYLGTPGIFEFTNRPALFAHLDKADPDDLAAAAKALADDAGALGKATSVETTTRDNLLEASQFLGRLAKVPKFAPQPWEHPLEKLMGGAADLQRALWLFEHGLARCVNVSIGARNDFDTHLFNTLFQPRLSNYVAVMLDKLFAELDARKVDGRSLAEQTLVVIGSEIGRFPRLNSGLGKDHFPQVSYLVFGPGVKAGTAYGVTGRDFISQPVSLRTGRPDKAGKLLTLDDLGTTLLALDGANPELYGYTGDRLEFLFAS